MENQHLALNDLVDGSEQEIVDLLRNLIRIPSLTGDEQAIGSFVASRCRDMGLAVRVVEAEPGRPNVIATWDTGLTGPALLLNDHLDTFPPGDVERWTHHPYAADVVDGHVYGRGAIDTKSGVATLLMGVHALKRAGAKLRGTLTLIFSCDEETGASRLGIRHLAELGLLRADLALVAEPTTMRIEIGTKSRLGVRIITRGVATHGARPWLGRNAILAMVRVIEELERLDEVIKRRVHPLLGPSSMNIGTISGGTIPNIVPDTCILEVDRRLIPGEDKAQALNEIRDIVDRLNAGPDGVDATLEERQWWPGYLVAELEPVVEAAKRAFRIATGSAAVVAGKDASTDASWINLLGGIPVVMFSPGDGNCAGNVDERVKIADLVAATRVVAQFVIQVLGDPGGRRAGVA